MSTRENHQVIGGDSVRYGKYTTHHNEYGPSLSSDWLKTKGSGRVMG